jgi:hypothetical protein
MSNPIYASESILVRTRQSSTGEWSHELWTAADFANPSIAHDEKRARRSVDKAIQRIIKDNELIASVQTRNNSTG